MVFQWDGRSRRGIRHPKSPILPKPETAGRGCRETADEHQRRGRGTRPANTRADTHCGSTVLRRRSITIVKVRSVSRTGGYRESSNGGHRHTVLSSTTTRNPVLLAEPDRKTG
jgi:hypothetical protein